MKTVVQNNQVRRTNERSTIDISVAKSLIAGFDSANGPMKRLCFSIKQIAQACVGKDVGYRLQKQTTPNVIQRFNHDQQFETASEVAIRFAASAGSSPTPNQTINAIAGTFYGSVSHQNLNEARVAT